MARIRTVKPDFSFDEELSQLSHTTRLFFILFWTHCDREGRCKDEPGKLRALIFPYEPEIDAEKLLAELHPHFIIRYQIDGKRYIQVRSWQHQRPHVRENESIIPPPPKELVKMLEIGVLPPDSKTESTTQAVPRQCLAPTQAVPSTLDKGNGEWILENGEWILDTGYIAPSPMDSEPPILTFPVVGKGSSWGLTKEKADSLKSAFPGVDVLAEARKALAWLEANPKKRKTANGMGNFLYGWMERTTNRGGRNGISQEPGSKRIVGDAAPIPGKYDHITGT